MNQADSSSYQFDLSSRLQDDEWDRFLESLPDNHHLQTSLWARLKSKVGWEATRLVARQGNAIVGGFQMLCRPVSFGSRVGYVPRGPVSAANDTVLCRLMVEKLSSLARSQPLTYLAAQPPQHGDQLIPELSARGFHASLFQSAPVATVLVDVTQSPDDLLAGMRKSTRRAIRKALASPLTVRVGKAEDLATFYSLMDASAQRHDFSTAPIDYFQEMWNLFAPSDHILLLIIEHAGEPVAAELDIAFGDTLVSKRAGWSGRYGSFHPNERLVWEAVNWARERGLKHFDLEGVDPELARAIHNGSDKAQAFKQTHHWFKLGFGGKVVLLPDNYELVVPLLLGWLHRTVWTRAARLRWTRSLVKQAIPRIRSRWRKAHKR